MNTDLKFDLVKDFFLLPRALCAVATQPFSSMSIKLPLLFSSVLETHLLH